MPGGRSILDSLSDTIDLNQGSVSSNNTMNQSTAWDGLLNQTRFSNMLSSGDRSVSCTSTSSHSARRFSGFDRGESSSTAHLEDRIYGIDLKIGHGWSTLMSARANSDARMHDCQSEMSSVIHHQNGGSYCGNQVTRRVLNINHSGSNHCPMTTVLHGGYIGNNDGSWHHTSSDHYRPGRFEVQETSKFGSSSDNLSGSSSSSGYLIENGDKSGSSLGAWGSSGKRKALEGSSSQFYPGGSSSLHPRAENSVMHTVPAHDNASGNIVTSAPHVNWSFPNQPEQFNPRLGVGMRGTASEILPPLSLTGITDTSAKNVGVRMNLGHLEPDILTLPFNGSALRPSDGGGLSHQQSRSFALTDSSMLMNSCNPMNHENFVSGYTESMLPFPWNVSPESQGGSSSNSFILSGDRGAAFRDDQNSLRNYPELPAFVDASEPRSLVQDPTTWNIASGNTSRSYPSSSRSGSSSGLMNLQTVSPPHPNLSAHIQQGLTEHAPWGVFPPLEPDDGSQRGPFPAVPPTAASSREAAVPSSSSRRRRQQFSRSASSMEEPGDAISGWRALAVDNEGRHRLIRRVLSAVRRGHNLRAQDLMLFDPFINGVPELHDRHSEMRLDVDNMSYEELLALEERIGNVSTGLSEEIITGSMKQREYQSVGSSSNSEPCCICREEYVAGDDIGIVNCGHEFHTNCIKQWLSLKNLCPICKMTALES